MYVGFPCICMLIKFGYFSLVNLSHIDLIIQPVERNLKEESFSIPYNIMIDLFAYFKRKLIRASVEERLFHCWTHQLDPAR